MVRITTLTTLSLALATPLTAHAQFDAILKKATDRALSGNAKRRPAPQKPQKPRSPKVAAARVVKNTIIAPDGRKFTVTERHENFAMASYVEMLEPAGAQVEFWYGDKRAHSDEVPFLWKQGKIRQYVKMVVSEGDQRWSAKIMLRNAARYIIRPAGAATKARAAAAAAPDPSPGRVISGRAFKNLVASLEDARFSDERLQILGKWGRKNERFTCAQLAKILGVLRHSSERMKALDSLAPKVVDADENSAVVMDALAFSGERSKARDLLP